MIQAELESEKIKSGKVYVRGNQVFPKSPVQAVRSGIGLGKRGPQKAGACFRMSQLHTNMVADDLKRY